MKCLLLCRFTFLFVFLFTLFLLVFFFLFLVGKYSEKLWDLCFGHSCGPQQIEEFAINQSRGRLRDCCSQCSEGLINNSICVAYSLSQNKDFCMYTMCIRGESVAWPEIGKTFNTQTFSFRSLISAYNSIITDFIPFFFSLLLCLVVTISAHISLYTLSWFSYFVFFFLFP